MIGTLSFKIPLFPTKKQEKVFLKNSALARGAFNNLVEIQKRNLNGELEEFFRSNNFELKFNEKLGINIFRFSKLNTRKVQQCYCSQDTGSEKDNSWLLSENSGFIRTRVADDFIQALTKNGFRPPKFKSAKRGENSFPVRCDSYDTGKCRVYKYSETKLQIPSVGKVRFKSKYLDALLNAPKLNARVKFDGKYWFLSFAVQLSFESSKIIPKIESLGVDMGLDSFVTTSLGKKYENFNKTNIKLLKLIKQKKSLQKIVSRKYEKSGKKYSNNQRKLYNKLRILDRRIANIRKNERIEIALDLVRTKPKTIVMENLNIKGMLKNRHLSRSIQDAGWYSFQQILQTLCLKRGINLVKAEKTCVSSKTCSCCGFIKPMPLSLRVYNCPNCGLSLDRDINAAKNLERLAS